MKYGITTNTRYLCVFGHRSMVLTEQNEKELYNLFEDFILNKKTGVFLFGGFGDFDSCCHRVVTKLKSKYPFIQRVYVCENYSYISRPNKRPKWIKDEDFEEFIYYETRYTGFYKRIYFRNCKIVDHSDYCVFWVNENANNSGALKTLQYAKSKKSNYINIFK